MLRKTYRGDLIAAHAAHQRALEEAGQVGRAIATAHAKHLQAIKAADEAQAALDAASATGNVQRLKALIDEQPAPSFPELQQRVADRLQVVRQAEADVVLLTEERRVRDGRVAVAAAGITAEIGHLLESTAAQMLTRLNELRVEEASLVNQLREFPTSSLPPFWADEREVTGDTALAHQWRDVVQALTHNPNAPTEPKNG